MTFFFEITSKEMKSKLRAVPLNKRNPSKSKSSNQRNLKVAHNKKQPTKVISLSSEEDCSNTDEKKNIKDSNVKKRNLKVLATNKRKRDNIYSPSSEDSSNSDEGKDDKHTTKRMNKKGEKKRKVILPTHMPRKKTPTRGVSSSQNDTDDSQISSEAELPKQASLSWKKISSADKISSRVIREKNKQDNDSVGSSTEEEEGESSMEEEELESDSDSSYYNTNC